MTIRDFKDQNAYVVGGSSGIGLAAAKILAEKGAHIVLFSRSEEKLQAALDEVRRAARDQAAQRFGYKALDVAVHDDVVNVMKQAVGEFISHVCSSKQYPVYKRLYLSLHMSYWSH